MKKQIQLFGVVILAMLFAPGAQAAVSCTNTITANVVVFDSPTVFNRLGAQNPNFISYALERDVVNRTTGVPCSMTGSNCIAGNVELRPDKRPRPLVVRSVEGSCLTVNLTNLLNPTANPNKPGDPLFINDNQVADRCASFHASGTELVNGMEDDGSMVGANPGVNIGPADAGQLNCGAGLAAPGETRTYELYTPKEGTFVINSYGATIGSDAGGGNLAVGMFGQLNVQPVGARIYRSQMTEEEMRLATVGTVGSDCLAGEVPGVDCNPGGQPIIDYEALYPNVAPWDAEGKAGLPIVNMICNAAAAATGACTANELVHSDINAIIAGPNPDGSFPASTYPLESVGKNNPAYPNRLEPFREFASIYHDEQAAVQVYPNWYLDPVLHYTLAGVRDAFMINYGSGGIGSEIISNRLHTGPMHDCTDCAYEEFFLASQTVGDPALLVNNPANSLIEGCDPSAIAGPTCWRDPVNLANGPIANNYALYQEDPSNVHHSYVGDATKIRNIHAGAFEQHIFHLHNQQWLQNPNDDNSNYLDAQEIMPGSGHTYELVHGGSGNRNKTAGDAIFHCHFYPHFAQGMWYHIRIHDVMETGTQLAVSDTATGFHDAPFELRSGKPLAGARALPDGELPDGTPIPAIVPLPGKAMAQMPADVSILAVDRGGHSILGGRTGPDGVLDSAQAVVDRVSVAGADGVLGTADDVSPGYPFWLAGNECGEPTADDPCPMGIVGQRMPTPPLDMLTEAGANAIGAKVCEVANVGLACTDDADCVEGNGNNQVQGTCSAVNPLFADVSPAQAGGWDGGLPRHAMLGYVSGGLSLDTNSRLSFSKVIEMAKPVYFPEVGTDLEQVSMAYHAVRERPSAANNLADNGTTPGSFVLNGAPPVPGGPFQDPCIDDAGIPLASGGTGSWFDGDGNPTTLNTEGGSAFGGDAPRTYKVANVQIDAVFNKVGYHYPQERIISLWEDVQPHILKQRPPEPLVMRFNTFDCGKILHSNLVPAEFELDDFQVRTPTDIIGQHIHLPKWDLTTNDGAANGWNYEDGALSPQMVQERIHAINEYNHFAGTIIPVGTLPGQLAPIDLTDQAPVATIDTGDPGGTPSGLETLAAEPHPFFGAGVAGQDHLGARTVIQRILVDPVVNVAGVDRGLGLTFSHDHYGPSTFQQIGLYSTILAEPAGSTWVHNESGELLGTREDGGPTTWQAAILPPAEQVGTVQSHLIPDHREFYFEMSDFQHAYEAGVYVGADQVGVPIHADIVQLDPFNATVADAPALRNTWETAINPPLKLKSALPDVVTAHDVCPGPLNADGTGITNASPFVTRPCPEAINISHSSMWVVNYRNEPVGLRVFDPNGIGPDGQNGTQTAGPGGDLALALMTRRDRAIPQLNTAFGDMPPGYQTPAQHCINNAQGQGVQLNGDGINCDRNAGDPITPIMRAYERDHVKVKIQVGATEEQHQTTIHGVKWLSNGSGFGRAPNSGWRNFQSHGISEQFSLQIPMNPDPNQRGNTVDYLYAQDATRDGMWSGTWGLMRTYGLARDDLFELPENPVVNNVRIVNSNEFNGVCPVNAPVKTYDVTAALANDILPNALGVTIPALDALDPASAGLTFGEQTVGGPLDPLGGTLVYNRRGTNVPTITVAEPGAPAQVFRGGDGPLNDPTAVMYVMTSDLGADGKLLPTAPVEPLVLRANAGDCIEVTLRNRLPADTPIVDAGPDGVLGTADDVIIGFEPNTGMPDLAGWQDMMWVVKRQVRIDPVTGAKQMHFFNNNLVKPSAHAGLHAQLVEYDMSRDDGVVVGGNNIGDNVAVPGGVATYRWYAGGLATEVVDQRRNRIDVQLTATPIEFGASNLLSADRIKQPQKGMFGSLVIEPAGAVVTEGTLVPDGQGTGAATRATRAQVSVSSPAGDGGSGGDYREALSIGHKISNLRWKDGTAIANINQGELGREGAEDSGHAGFNYGMEPSWFRFQLPPDVPFGNAATPNSFGSEPNAHAMYANELVALEPNTVPDILGVATLGDPLTPVFRATADPANPVSDTRMYVLNGASADRDGTFIVHGHLWQREPYVCTGLSQDDEVGLAGRCDPDAPVASMAIGNNLQSKYMGGQEGMGHVFAHWPLLFDAGGTGAVTGDYLYRDYTPSGNRNGQFGILRVE